MENANKIIWISLLYLIFCFETYADTINTTYHYTSKTATLTVEDKTQIINWYTILRNDGCALKVRHDIYTDRSGFSVYVVYRGEAGLISKESRKCSFMPAIESRKLFELLMTKFNIRETMKNKGFIYFSPVPISLYSVINEDKTWDKNIRSTHSYKSYVDKLRRNLTHPDVFGQYIDYFASIGCKVSLTKYFGDPIYDIKTTHLTKTEIIKKGFLGNTAAKKDIYPTFKGGISFNFSCKSN